MTKLGLLPTDHLFDDRYRIRGVLGQGAHGVVYRADDEVLSSTVAIKCLHQAVSNDHTFKTRLAREARAMGALSGTSAVQIFAFNRSSDGAIYIVMEVLEGRDFEEYLIDIERQGGQLDVYRLVDLLSPIAQTLDKAHEVGIIHRDIKPANIFILDSSARGGVRLLDFGLAKDLKADALTLEGTVAGSPSYIAPEIWRGKSHQADSRIDVYSFGCVVFRALSGQPPFGKQKAFAHILMEATRGARPSLFAFRPDLPRSVDEWVEKALAIDREDRFGSVGKMWQAFTAICDRRSAAARPPQLPIHPVQPWEIEIDLDL